MAYAQYNSRTYRSHTSVRSSVISMDLFDSGMILRVGLACVALLGLIYVFETNALMFLERTMPAKERALLEVKNDVNALEIQATRLQASQTVQAAALSNAMVAPREVSYVTNADSAVAMISSVR